MAGKSPNIYYFTIVRLIWSNIYKFIISYLNMYLAVLAGSRYLHIV